MQLQFHHSIQQIIKEMAAIEASSRVVAGVTLVNADVVNATLEFARAHYDDMLFNHVYRSWIFGALFASKNPAFANVDLEVHAVATLLHDIALDHKSTFSTPNLRFEVDGANAARDFLQKNAPDWEPRRIQLVWDAIAIHTTRSIAFHSAPEVSLCCMGVIADFLGPNMFGGILTSAEFKSATRELPYLNLKDGLKKLVTELCTHKAETTYDNASRDFGELLVPGYDPTPGNAANRLLQPIDVE